MRTSVIVCLLLIGLFGLGLRSRARHDRPLVGFPAEVAHAQQPRVSQRQSDRRMTIRTAQQPQVALKAEVVSSAQTTSAAAHQDALRQVSLAVREYMREKFIGYRYEPTPKFIEENRLVVDTKSEDVVIAEADAPTMVRERLTLELYNPQIDTLLQEDRRERSLERLWQGGKILGGVLVALMALIGYVRVDDWTKGYLSTALKFIAIALAVAGGALLWLLM